MVVCGINHPTQVVTVGGHVVIEKHDPNKTKGSWVKKALHRINPFVKVKNAFRRRANSNNSNNYTNSKDSVVSNQYSLHVVANGFEVRLHGEFVWGCHVATSS